MPTDSKISLRRVVSPSILEETSEAAKTVAILLPDLRCGGAERSAVNLANTFSQRGHRVEILLLSAKGELLSRLEPEISVRDFKVDRLRDSVLPLTRYLRAAKPDALLACMWPLSAIGIWSRQLARVKTRVVVAEHTTWSGSDLLKSKVTRWLARATMQASFPFADGIVTVSNGAADDLAQFARIDRRRISRIYNPVVGNAKAKVDRAHPPLAWWVGPHRRILAVGTLVGAKNYADLLEAFALLRRRIDAKLLILGEGERRPELETQARRLGIEKYVFMPGFVNEPSPYFQHAELLVLSSITEGLPTVIIEALEAGTPVVSTDCPSGPAEILSRGQFGRLVAVGDTTAMANAIRESLEAAHDIEVLMARASDFSISSASDQYLELLFPS